MSADRQASRVHEALYAVTEAARTIPADSVLVDGQGVYVIAPNIISAQRWHARYPTGRVEAGGLMVPLHIAVTGDVEGGVL